MSFPSLVLPAQKAPLGQTVAGNLVASSLYYLWFQTINTAVAGAQPQLGASDLINSPASAAYQSPANVPEGTLFYQTDTGLFYQSRRTDAPQPAAYWAYVLGTMDGPLNARPTNLGTNDAGLLYDASDTFQQFRWSGMAWIAVSATAGTVSSTQILDLALSVASTTVNVPTTGAVDLAVILRQDGTGGRAVVWGAGFSGASTSLGAALANTIATFRFVLSGGKYVQIGQQTVDMAP